jgi:hypothetical protein
MIILTNWSYDDNLFYEDLIKHLIHLINELLHIFPRQTRVIKCCFYNVGTGLDNKNVLNHLLDLLN